MARPKQPIPRYIDPNFPLPEGLIDVAYMPLPDLSDEDLIEVEEIDLEQDFADDFVETLDEPDDAPDVPESFTVVDQIVRFAPDGSQVVDVIIEVEDVEGITKYDVRKTKT
jgi:hypothetical protein